VNPLIVEIETRLMTLFTALAAGDDASPSQVLRLEGLLEAAVLLQISAESDLTLTMQNIYQQAHGRSLEEDAGEQWRQLYRFPQIPAIAKRAPVHPSTSD